jgi:uncharacterized protein
MGSFWFEALEIDDHILDKIESRHGVTFAEVHEACLAEERHVRRGREGLYKLFSQSAAGRYLLVVLANSGTGVWRVVTAREMTQEERRLYRRSIGD